MLSPGLFPASETPVCNLGQLCLLLPGLSGKSLQEYKSPAAGLSSAPISAELCSAAVCSPSLERSNSIKQK